MAWMPPQTEQFEFKPFSMRQKAVLSWWTDESPYKDYNGIIADGSIRSGKTLSMSLSFGLWGMTRFSGRNFALCGKTVGSLRRNVVRDFKAMMHSRGYAVQDRRGDNLIIVGDGKKENYFYLFGGRDERSQDLIQGITLAGVLLDEVALMPESFVNQATARCSVDGSKLWFNCNPDNSQHWFKQKWINHYEQNRMVYLHFTMDDNLSLSEEVKKRNRSLYTGAFYLRYVEGLWVSAEGVVYPMFDPGRHVVDALPEMRFTWIGCDIGHTNPTAFLRLGAGKDGLIYVMDEYYHSGGQAGSKSPRQYAQDLIQFAAPENGRGFLLPQAVVIDPAAEGFILQLREMSDLRIRRADNPVLEGIQMVSSALDADKIRIHRRCKHLIDELQGYVWDEKAQERGEDKPVKQNDHACDALRYALMEYKRDIRRMIAYGDTMAAH